MSTATPRVRFAPSPTGIMHIGNSRTALLNFLFAQQKNGTLVLRIEDTDPSRNFDPGAKIILDDLAWLSLVFNEGPSIGGSYAPYFQSERQAFYQKKLAELIKKNMIYRCFCTEEELAKKRERQRALKKPPRYDRTCLNLSQEEVEKQLAKNMPFIWRFKLDHNKTIQIADLARGTVSFDLKNFSDFPLTRSDGTFTFMFANFVDDMMMKITHVFRGEDHQSNTAGQAALYLAFDAPLPIFWHMPMLCNINGKKLSKRDFGFSLHDLRDAGYLPQAINNYLAIIGGSYKDEIMDLKELAHAVDFDHPHATGQIKYDVEKLRWVNHAWIQKLSPSELEKEVKPFLKVAYPQVEKLDTQKLTDILQIIKTDLYTLKDAVDALAFYFTAPEISKAVIEQTLDQNYIEPIKKLLSDHLNTSEDIDGLKKSAKQAGIPIKQLFWFLRLALMGQTNGPSIHDLIAMLGVEESKQRIERLLNQL